MSQINNLSIISTATDWDDDELSRFLKMVRHNQEANIISYKESYEVIARINACLLKIASNLVNPQPLFTGVLCMRSKYAYMAAVGMALSGQLVECFPMLRVSLECAGYAILIFDDPKLEHLLINRHESVANKKDQIKKFAIGRVIEVIKKYDAKLADNFQLFYDRSIDFGAHPNQHALFSAMTVNKVDDQAQKIGQLALHADQTAILHALKSAGQVGLTVLFIFQHIFKAKFEILGVRAEMNNLRQANL